MKNEIILLPNNEIRVNGKFTTKITFVNKMYYGIIIHVSPISSSKHIEDDLDVMYDVAEHLYQLYTDAKIVKKGFKDGVQYSYSDLHKAWVINLYFRDVK